MTFIQGLKTHTDNLTETENGAVALKSSGSALLDFFAMGSALRSDREKFFELFLKASEESELFAAKLLFYTRDIRGGQGERETFRYALSKMANYPSGQQILKGNLELIPFFGRWDDILSLLGTPLEEDAVEFLKFALLVDLEKISSGNTKEVSLLAKWLPSVNTSSRETRKTARYLARKFNMSERDYRKNLSMVRSVIGIVESKISKGDYLSILYDKLPSRALLKYRKNFVSKDAIRYAEFLQAVKTGDKKLNAGTLYPYDIVAKIVESPYSIGGKKDPEEIEYLNSAWNSLPNYMQKEENSICVVDVSGSMFTKGNPSPISVAISLGIYFAQRNVGAFKDHFITFSQTPKVNKIVGDNISDIVKKLSTSEWGMSTDLQSVFSAILKFALKNNAANEELPRKVYIISDMQFNQAVPQNSNTNFEEIQNKYSNAGYDIPEIVYWNVNARGGTSPVAKDDRGTYLVSGCSPSILKHALNVESATPMTLMMEVINSKRYSIISWSRDYV